MPNANKEAQLLLDSVFNVKAHVNLTFVADPTMQGSSRAAMTRPSSFPLPGTSNIIANFHDTIFINPDFVNSASKEYMVSILYHEAIHAYMNYNINLFLNHVIDSNKLKEMFPIYWATIAPGSADQAHHEQMASSYVNTIKELIKPFYNPIAPLITKERGIRSLAWGGLTKTSPWKSLGSDTCQINADNLGASRYGFTAYYNTPDCSTIGESIALKLSPPCN